MERLFDEDLRATIEENLRLKSHTAGYEMEIKRQKVGRRHCPCCLHAVCLASRCD
jgi:hypothetical protein